MKNEVLFSRLFPPALGLAGILDFHLCTSYYGFIWVKCCFSLHESCLLHGSLGPWKLYLTEIKVGKCTKAETTTTRTLESVITLLCQTRRLSIHCMQEHIAGQHADRCVSPRSLVVFEGIVILLVLHTTMIRGICIVTCLPGALTRKRGDGTRYGSTNLVKREAILCVKYKLACSFEE